MAERVETVRLLANVSNYIAGMEAAQLKTQRLAATSTARLAAQRAAFTELGTAALAVGAVAAVAVGMAVAKFAEFDQAMSNAGAVTEATASEMRDFREAALDAGGDTIYTATEAANAIEELSKAGLDASDILGGALRQSLDLASAGQLEVARSAEILATTLKQYSLDGADAERVADGLAAGAGKALGSVEDLAQGLKFVGPIAASMGVSLEETIGTLALFADQGIIGEQAGTSLRGVLASLTSPSKEAADEIKRLGIELYDAQGNFLGLENLAGQLAGAYGDLDDKSRDASLGIIFGNMQVTAARVLFEQGADKVAEYTDAVDSSGYASKVAAERLDNLRGDVEKLSGAFDTALIKSGSGANDVLRGLVQSATFLVEAIGGLPEPVLGAGLAVGALVAAVALAGGTALLAIPRFLALKNSMEQLGISGGKVAKGIGLIGGAVGLASFLLGAFIAAQADAKASSDAFADSLNDTTGAVTDYTRELVAKRLQEKGAFEGANQAGISQRELTDAVIEGGAALEDVNRRLMEYRDSLVVVGSRGADPNSGFTKTSQAIEGVRSELDSANDSWENATAATADNSDALARMEGRAAAAEREISGLADTIRGFGSATLDTRDAERQFQAAIDDATAALAENGATLDRGTEQGRANEAALDDIATSALELAAAKYEETQNTEQATAAIQAGRDALIQQLEKYGIVGQAAEDYANSLGLIPSNVSTFLTLDASPAFAALDQLKSKLAGNKAALSSLNNWRPASFASANGNMFSYASGGFGEGMYSGGTPLYKFAEPETGWEAFISGRPGAEARNRQIWAEAGSRLGMGGGMSGPMTALVDPAFVRAVRELAAARRSDLDTVGLSRAAAAGSARSASLGAI